jgi:hypothetical protein
MGRITFIALMEVTTIFNRYNDIVNNVPNPFAEGLGAFLKVKLFHSYLKASIGFNREARRAG